MIDERAWMTWSDVWTRIDRYKGKVIFFGYSKYWIDKTLPHISSTLRFTVVDNSENFQGQACEYSDLPIHEPDDRIYLEEDFIIITSLSYESIYEELVGKEFEPGIDFCITPAMNDLKVISDIHSHGARLLISSPDHLIYSDMDRNSNIGGGLYIYNIGTNECNKVATGTFRQMVKGKDDLIYILDEARGILIGKGDYFNNGWIHIDKELRPHGLAYCEENERLFLAATNKNQIIRMELTGDGLHIGDSNLIFNSKRSHWVNDLVVKDGEVYASMFSLSGLQSEGMYDGGIIRVGSEESWTGTVVAERLWMPHSVRFFNGAIHYLDSMNGLFYKGSRVIGEFPGFTRGLAYDGKYYYVGQSENRYFNLHRGERKHIGMNAGFYLFDEETKAAKFFSMPMIHQVHDIMVL